MKGRAPTSVEKKHMRLVGAMPCIACEKDGYYNDYVSLHHIDGRVKPDAHLEVLPLCASHHQHNDSDPMGRIGIHPYKARFEMLYGTSVQLLTEIKLKIQGEKHGAC
jgi:hypothetical protein